MEILPEFRSGCPIATTLDMMGDRWTLVIVRDLLTGKKRFGEFLESPERITTSVLTTRLKQMEAFGVVDKNPYQNRPTRFEYTLTDRGLELQGILQEMCRWANKHMPGTWTPPDSFMKP
jgi:DNA-binding HxlR family transcriptional regulator